jgi:hypothetical protein
VAGAAVTAAAVGVAAAGAATTVIGGSEVAEGGQDVVFGALGSDTSSVNVVRDFGFGGDEAAYNQAKGIVTTTASVGTMVLAPVAQTVSAASGGARPEKAVSTKQTKTTGNTGGNATAGKTATVGTSGKSTTSAMKLKSGETDAVGQTKTAANAGTRSETVSNKPVPVKLKYKSNWNAQQRNEADAKVEYLNNCDTIKTTPQRSNTSAAQRYRMGKGSIPNGKDIDHKQDLQLNGKDVLENMEPLDASVNRSLGKQINNQIKDLPDGTKVGPFSIEER